MDVAEHNPVMTLPRGVGVVLAAGEGRRFGGPKGLVRGADGVGWVEVACRVLVDGGCGEVVVVVGARGEDVAELVPDGVRTVVAADWATGISASLRAGLAAAARTSADVAVVTLVDLPGLRPEAVRRVLGAATGPAAAESVAARPAHPAAVGPAHPAAVRRALVRAAYDGAPGHPVLLGRAHWDAVAAAVHGDTGAGPYLRAHGAAAVDCTDLGGGDDVDHTSV